MGLQQRVSDDLRSALKSHDALRVSVLRLLLSAISYKSIDKHGELTDEEVEGVVASEAKKRRESVAAFRGKRDDLADKEQAELEILEVYLPEAMSEEGLTKVVEETLGELSEEQKQNSGRVVGMVMGKLKGQRVEGSKVKDMVEKRLSIK